MVVAVFVAAFLALCGIGAVVVVRSDRKRATWAAGGVAADLSPLPPGTPVDVFVDRDTATRIAVRAVEQVGGRDIKVLEDGSVVGWIGSPLTNVPSKAEYMVAVARIIQPDGSVVLACSCQSRFSTMAFAGRRSADVTQRLVSEVTSLASNPTA